jgi:hypothetical protein
MLNLLALYRGRNLQDIKTVTVSTDPRVIRQFVKSVLQSSHTDENDLSLKSIADGQRKALEAILQERD